MARTRKDGTADSRLLATGKTEIRRDGHGNVMVIEEVGGHVVLDPSRDPWDQQKQESSRQYHHFCLYRDLEPSQRTMTKAWRAYVIEQGGYQPGITSTPSPWYSDLRRQFRWNERIVAYDRWMDKNATEALRLSRTRARVEAAELGRTLRLKAMRAAKILQTVTMQTVRGPDGEMMKVARSNLSPQAIVQLARAGVDLERIALGMDFKGAATTAIQVNVNTQPTIDQMGDNSIVAQAERILEQRRHLIEAEATLVARGPASSSPDKGKGNGHE